MYMLLPTGSTHFSPYCNEGLVHHYMHALDLMAFPNEVKVVLLGIGLLKLCHKKDSHDTCSW